MCCWTVLKAEEKSTNTILACVLLPSRCLSIRLSGVAVASVLPERVHWTIVHELVDILGERELNILYYCLMNVTVNAFILVYVNCTLTQFNFVQYGARLENPAKTHRKQAFNDSGIFNIEPPFWLWNRVVGNECWLLVLSRVFGSFRNAPACFRMMSMHKPFLKTTLNVCYQKCAHRVVSCVRWCFKSSIVVKYYFCCVLFHIYCIL